MRGGEVLQLAHVRPDDHTPAALLAPVDGDRVGSVAVELEPLARLVEE